MIITYTYGNSDVISSYHSFSRQDVGPAFLRSVCYCMHIAKKCERRG